MSSRFVIALGAIGLLAVGSTQVSASGELNVLTWEGYTDPSFVEPFEQASGCKLTATYVGSNDEFPAKLATGGGAYDLVSPSVDTTSILRKMGLVEALDSSKLTYWNDLYEAFRDHPGVSHGGQVYGVPVAWGSIAFMYMKDKFPTPPTSASVMWDKSLSGKISMWDDKTSIYITARMLFG